MYHESGITMYHESQGQSSWHWRGRGGGGWNAINILICFKIIKFLFVSAFRQY